MDEVAVVETRQVWCFGIASKFNVWMSQVNTSDSLIRMRRPQWTQVLQGCKERREERRSDCWPMAGRAHGLSNMFPSSVYCAIPQRKEDIFLDSRLAVHVVVSKQDGSHHFSHGWAPEHKTWLSSPTSEKLQEGSVFLKIQEGTVALDADGRFDCIVHTLEYRNPLKYVFWIGIGFLVLQAAISEILV